MSFKYKRIHSKGFQSDCSTYVQLELGKACIKFHQYSCLHIQREVCAETTSLTLGSKMTKWLKSAMRCSSSRDLLSLAYDKMVPASWNDLMLMIRFGED